MILQETKKFNRLLIDQHRKQVMFLRKYKDQQLIVYTTFVQEVCSYSNCIGSHFDGLYGLRETAVS
jgi:hypothetical protein